MSLKLVMLPPQTQVYRNWGKALQEEFSGLEVVIAETDDQAAAAIVDAYGAVGGLPKDLLAKAIKLRWLQSHQAAPPAGYYYAELIAHPLVVASLPSRPGVQISGVKVLPTARGNLLARKQQLFELLQENPGLHEREEIERQLAEIDEVLNLLDE